MKKNPFVPLQKKRRFQYGTCRIIPSQKKKSISCQCDSITSMERETNKQPEFTNTFQLCMKMLIKKMKDIIIKIY